MSAKAVRLNKPPGPPPVALDHVNNGGEDDRVQLKNAAVVQKLFLDRDEIVRACENLLCRMLATGKNIGTEQFESTGKIPVPMIVMIGKGQSAVEFVTDAFGDIVESHGEIL